MQRVFLSRCSSWQSSPAPPTSVVVSLSSPAERRSRDESGVLLPLPPSHAHYAAVTSGEWTIADRRPPHSLSPSPGAAARRTMTASANDSGKQRGGCSSRLLSPPPRLLHLLPHRLPPLHSSSLSVTLHPSSSPHLHLSPQPLLRLPQALPPSVLHCHYACPLLLSPLSFSLVPSSSRCHSLLHHYLPPFRSGLS